MPPIRRRLRFSLLLGTVLLGACGSVVRKATDQFSDNLNAAILNEDDPGTVRDGLPAYLLLIDGVIQGDPDNADALLSGAKLYGAYAGGFVSDPVRAQRLAGRAFHYAHRALCLREKKLCAVLERPYDVYLAELDKSGRGDVPTVYGFAAAWAGKIQVDSGDWNAIADLPKLQATLQHCAKLAPAYDNGGAYLYLGVINSIRPAALGGKPEQGKAYFEKALELSGGRNQMVRVLYAQFYARLVFDKNLHDKLLNEVLAADPHVPGLTLINILAQRKAKALLESGKDYF